MERRYRYLGSAELSDPASPPARTCVRSAEDVRFWMRETGQRFDAVYSVTATFIVDTGGALWIADRHSEHVQCARGNDILSAGEITFSFEDREMTVSAITNQSTGYCPEPESWPAVDSALRAAAISHPPYWTGEMIFRRCPSCGTKNIVKENWFECGVCQNALPPQWNFS